MRTRNPAVSFERDLQSIAQRGCEQIYREIPEYAGVPQGDVLAGNLDVVRAVYSAITEGRSASPEELAVLARIGEARARAGVPFHALMRGLRMVASLVLESEVATGPSDADRLWRWVVETLEVVSAAHRQVELEMTREDRYRRAAFLTDLFGGRLGGTKLAALAAEFGLDPDERYLAFRSRVPGAETRRRFEEAAEGAGLIESHQGELVGLLVRCPRLHGDGLVAIGQRLPLASAAFSFGQASTTLRVATALSMSGVVDIADIPLHAAVIESPHVTDLVTERCLGSIPAGQRRMFTKTLAVYLEHNLNVAEAAAVLHVHPNTLRYRIRRFEELSGLHLERIDDLVAVWWACQHDRIIHQEGTAAAG